MEDDKLINFYHKKSRKQLGQGNLLQRMAQLASKTGKTFLETKGKTPLVILPLVGQPKYS